MMSASQHSRRTVATGTVSPVEVSHTEPREPVTQRVEIDGHRHFGYAASAVRVPVINPTRASALT